MARISEDTKKQIKLTQEEKSNSTKYNTMIEVFFQAINLNEDGTYSKEDIDKLLEQVIAAVEGGNIAKGTYATLADATTDLDPTGNFPDSNKWTINIDGTGTDQPGIYKWFQTDDATPGEWVFSSQFTGLATDDIDGLLSKELHKIISKYPAYVDVDGRITANTEAINLIAKKVEEDAEEITKLADLVEQSVKEITANTSGIKKNAQDIATNKGAGEENARKIGVLDSNKQNEILDYKKGVDNPDGSGNQITIEQQVEANEKETKEAKTREDNFVKKDDGKMADGYNATGDKEVIVKETFDDQKAAMQKAIDAINTELALKADVADIGQKALVFVPSTPIAPTETGGSLIYTYSSIGTEFADWLALQVDSDGNSLIQTDDKVDYEIKDDAGDTYAITESWNNPTGQVQPFGSDVNAIAQATTTTLDIATNNQNRQVDRTIRKITFIVSIATGGNVDQVARDAIAKLKLEAQTIAIDLIGISSKTVTGALTELKNRIDAVEAAIKGISYDEPSKTTSISDNVEIGETLNAKKITQEGKAVALKEEILDIIPTDENNNTVGEVRAAIKASLNDIQSRKSVIFQHADTTQKDDTYNGFIEIIDDDPIEKTKAYFGESSFNSFTTPDDGRPQIFQLFLNIIGWKAWQKTLVDTDPRRAGTDAEIDAFTQAQLDDLTIFKARRETPLNVASENVLTDSDEDDPLTELETLIDGGL